MSATRRITVVDAFTDAAFTGNPAAVCELDTAADERWMQSVAGEMNLAETAFVVPREDGDHDLRWFTPTTEVDLCGHATLAASHVLGATVARFHTRSGLLTCRLLGDRIEMDFPSIAGVPVPLDPRVVEALGAVVRTVHNGPFLLAELNDESTVRELQPDPAALAGLHPQGVIVTASASADSAFDFVSRVFAPNVGIPEDPVTGSAHCQLAPFWAARLGRTELRGAQASARGGIVGVRVEGDRVVLSGRAVTVLVGTLCV